MLPFNLAGAPPMLEQLLVPWRIVSCSLLVHLRLKRSNSMCSFNVVRLAAYDGPISVGGADVCAMCTAMRRGRWCATRHHAGIKASGGTRWDCPPGGAGIQDPRVGVVDRFQPGTAQGPGHACWTGSLLVVGAARGWSVAAAVCVAALSSCPSSSRSRRNGRTRAWWRGGHTPNPHPETLRRGACLAGPRWRGQVMGHGTGGVTWWRWGSAVKGSLASCASAR